MQGGFNKWVSASPGPLREELRIFFVKKKASRTCPLYNQVVKGDTLAKAKGSRNNAITMAFRLSSNAFLWNRFADMKSPAMLNNISSFSKGNALWPLFKEN